MSRSPLAVRMTWHDVLFLHWRLPPERLARHVPAGLELDVFDGAAWLGVVPFRMSAVGPRWLPPLPWLSTTPELNVRTYVRQGGCAGVWFFSLDAANPAVVETARRGFHLPYRHATMRCRRRGGWIEYRCDRDDPCAVPAAFRARYRPVGPVERARPGTLEHWLTERYCLFARDACGRLFRGDIRHAPWPLQPAEVELASNAMTDDLVEGPLGPPACAHFAQRLDVVAAPLTAARGPGPS
jgi:uncharacterized protein YqjF (DUF2071 family)